MKQLLIFLLSFICTLYPEGFASNTQIKTKNGYRSIEYVHQDTRICSYNFAKKKQSYSKVCQTYRSRVPYYIRLFFDNRIVDVAPDQKLYIANLDKWIFAENIVNSSFLQEICQRQMGLFHAAYVLEPIDVYIFTLKKYHTFYVSEKNILAHNFDLSFASAIPEMTMIAPMAAEGLMDAIQTGHPAIIAGAVLFLGGYCLYNWASAKWQDKKEAKHIRRKLELERQRMLEEERRNSVASGGPNKDPKNKKKNERKPPREYTQEDYELMNNDKKFTELSFEDRDWLIENELNLQRQDHYIMREAKELNFQWFRGTVEFNSHNQKVFRRGHTYITYDIDRHKGGFWKMYKYNKEPRVGTFNINLKKMVGK